MLLFLCLYVIPAIMSIALTVTMFRLDGHTSLSWFSEWKFWVIPVMNWIQPFLFLWLIVEVLWTKYGPKPKKLG